MDLNQNLFLYKLYLPIQFFDKKTLTQWHGYGRGEIFFGYPKNAPLGTRPWEFRTLLRDQL